MAGLNQIWNNILSEVEPQVSALTFDLWIKTLEPICVYKDRLILLTQTEAHCNIVKNRFHPMIKNASIKTLPSLIDVEIITPDLLPSFEQYQEYETPITTKNDAEDERADFILSYTFENFVIGKSNQFAAAVCLAVAEKVATQKPSLKYNPLFLYGGVGLGKTHLMHAIGNYIREANSQVKPIYVSSERFTNQLIDAIRNTSSSDSIKEFRNKYRNADVLMIDDIQFISKTPSTQEEIFHAFNDLYLAGKQIIISSDRPPKEIAPLEERLRTRFTSGVIADIGQPDLEMRVAILQKCCAAEKVNIDTSILTMIAERITTNVRDLKGLLTRVISYATLTEGDINNAEVVESAIKDYTQDAQEVLTMDNIAQKVCDYYRVDIKDLKGKKKNKEVVVPRQVCIYLITEFMSVPLINIGEFFGGRDHTTVMHARDKISEQIKLNKVLANQIKDLKDFMLRR